MTAIGVPIKILHEAEGHIITLETCVGRFTKDLIFKLFYLFYKAKIHCISNQ